MAEEKRRRRPTLALVAREAGVSIGTASNILGGKEELHSPETVARVQSVARHLGYRPNRLARSLVSRKSHTVGVLMEPVHAIFTRNPYAAAVLDGLLLRLGEKGYHIKLISLDRHDPKSLWAQIDDGSIDGAVVIAPLIDSPLLEWYHHTNLPCVVVGAELPDSYGLYCIEADNAQGIGMLVDHLVELGHRRIGMILGPKQQYSRYHREQAFRQTLHARGLKVREEWMVEGSYTVQSGYEAMQRLLMQKELPTALVASNDNMAVGAVEACRQANIPIPERLSIVGFDDAPSASIVSPSLTTIHVPLSEIGSHAVDALLEQLTSGVPKRGTYRVPVELIIRESTAPPYVK